jgi:TM2 domain-containing membrane protein YozV
MSDYIMQPKKNPGLAAVASFFFSGLGQIYNGESLISRLLTDSFIFLYLFKTNKNIVCLFN